MEDRTIVAHGCRKTKKMICGIEGKNVVAYGCLPSPAPATRAEQPSREISKFSAQ